MSQFEHGQWYNVTARSGRFDKDKKNRTFAEVIVEVEDGPRKGRTLRWWGWYHTVGCMPITDENLRTMGMVGVNDGLMVWAEPRPVFRVSCKEETRGDHTYFNADKVARAEKPSGLSDEEKREIQGRIDLMLGNVSKKVGPAATPPPPPPPRMVATKKWYEWETESGKIETADVRAAIHDQHGETPITRAKYEETLNNIIPF